MSDRPILVVGCPRSGTTLLQLMLHAHPRIAIPPENRFVLAAYERRRSFGDLTDEQNRRELARYIVDGKGTKFGDFGLDRDEMVERIATAPPTLGSALGAVLSAYSRKFDKPRWGDKRPSYVRYLPVLLRLFPDAQVINIVRDGRDCVASLLEMPWHPHGFYYTASQWVAAIDAGQRAARWLPADSYCQLRYEDLVASPEPQLRRLCDFLGEQYDPAMAEPDRMAAVAVPSKKRWHHRTHKPVTTERAGSWADRLEPWQISVCEAVFGDRLRALGYELAGAARPAPEHRLRYERAAVHRRMEAARMGLARAWYRLAPGTSIAAAKLP